MIEFDVRTTDQGIGVVAPRDWLNMVAARQLRDIDHQLATCTDRGRPGRHHVHRPPRWAPGRRAQDGG